MGRNYSAETLLFYLQKEQQNDLNNILVVFNILSTEDIVLQVYITDANDHHLHKGTPHQMPQSYVWFHRWHLWHHWRFAYLCWGISGSLARGTPTCSPVANYSQQSMLIHLGLYLLWSYRLFLKSGHRKKCIFSRNLQFHHFIELKY